MTLAHKLAPLFSTGKDNWQTPPDLFAWLHYEFNFTIDSAANETNHLCPKWFGPGSENPDALTTSWRQWGDGERVFVNPPYTAISQFVAKGAAERLNGVLSVFLIPSRTDTRWWHEHIWDTRSCDWKTGVSGRFLKGRVKFIDPTGARIRGTGPNCPNSAPFPSAVIVFNPRQETS